MKSQQIDIVLDQRTLMILIFGRQPKRICHTLMKIFFHLRAAVVTVERGESRAKKACHIFQITFSSLAGVGERRKSFSMCWNFSFEQSKGIIL